jgi:hypothetical protein
MYWPNVPVIGARVRAARRVRQRRRRVERPDLERAETDVLRIRRRAEAEEVLHDVVERDGLLAVDGDLRDLAALRRVGLRRRHRDLIRHRRRVGVRQADVGEEWTRGAVHVRDDRDHERVRRRQRLAARRDRRDEADRDRDVERRIRVRRDAAAVAERMNLDAQRAGVGAGRKTVRPRGHGQLDALRRQRAGARSDGQIVLVDRRAERHRRTGARDEHAELHRRRAAERHRRVGSARDASLRRPARPSAPCARTAASCRSSSSRARGSSKSSWWRGCRGDRSSRARSPASA